MYAGSRLVASALAALAATLSYPVAAQTALPASYRVVEVAGSQTLVLKAGPSPDAGSIIELPFNTRGLKPTGMAIRGWLQLTYVSDARDEYTGWAQMAEVAVDDGYQPTVFRIVDATAGGIPAFEQPGSGRQLGTIPADARGVLALGACVDGFCPVRYTGRQRDLEGWVSAGNLAVAGPVRATADGGER